MKRFDDSSRKGADISKGTKEGEGQKVIAEHTVVKGDTLGEIAQKYYGDSSRRYYMYIYNKNKDVIGKDPDMIMVGTKLKIYELTEGLKGN